MEQFVWKVQVYSSKLHTYLIVSEQAIRSKTMTGIARENKLTERTSTALS
jgi:hypothetical protein